MASYATLGTSPLQRTGSALPLRVYYGSEPVESLKPPAVVIAPCEQALASLAA
jgi:hypothetical protein